MIHDETEAQWEGHEELYRFSETKDHPYDDVAKEYVVVALREEGSTDWPAGWNPDAVMIYGHFGNRWVCNAEASRSLARHLLKKLAAHKAEVDDLKQKLLAAFVRIAEQSELLGRKSEKPE